ncbi:MAG: molybdate ABC transporter substrate-binding protein [Lutispora sp.]|nr:molybdate ABC transporter substrate-binding protein [Lutispora sp.]
MKKCVAFILLIASLLSLTACSKPAEPAKAAEPIELNISAAASLKDVLLELQPEYEKNNNVKLVLNFGASGTLQKQIEEGAPSDVFISAGKKQMDALEEKGLIVKESRKNLFGNSLVLIVAEEAKDKILKIEDITKAEVDKISIGTPESVPAGSYAKESLENLQMWKDIEPKLVLAKDVRQVLTYVETGEVDAGIVYSSDAALLKKGTIVGAFPADSHKPVVYPAALINEGKQKEEAKKFLDFLSSDKAAETFSKYGFEVLK